MIGIKITQQNKFLDLFSDIEIPVKISNPLFDEGITEGTYLFSITLPNTKNNATLLNYPNRVNKRDFTIVAQKFDCQIFYKFNLWKEGVLIITSANDKTIEISVALNESIITSKLKDVNLKDVENMDKDFIYAYHHRFNSSEHQSNWKYPDRDLCLPTFINKSVCSNINIEGISDFFRDSHFYINRYQYEDRYLEPYWAYSFWKLDDEIWNGVGGFSFIAPSLFNSFILKNILKDYDIKDCLFFDNNDINNLILFNPNPCGTSFYRKGEAFNTLKSRIPYSFFIPNVKVLDYINALFSLFNCFITYNPDKTISIINKNNIINKNEFIYFKSEYIKDIIFSEFENEEIDSYSFAMKQISDGFQNEFIKDIEKYNIKGFLEDIDGLPTENNEFNDAYLVYDINPSSPDQRKFWWYVYSWDDENLILKWDKYSYDFPFTFSRTQVWEDIFKYFKTPKYTHSVEAGTVLDDYFQLDSIMFPDLPARHYRCPIINKSVIINNIYNTYNNEFKDIIFLFWHGFVPSIQGDLIPYASYDNKTTDNNKISEYALRWDGEDGLFEKFHKDFYLFKQNTIPFEMEVNMPEDMVLKFDLMKKYTTNQINFMVTKINFSITNSGIKKVILSCVKL